MCTNENQSCQIPWKLDLLCMNIKVWAAFCPKLSVSAFPQNKNPSTQAGRQHNMAAALEAEGQGLGGTRGCATMKKNIWVTGQLPTPSITINGPAHTPPPSPSINALAGSEVM